MTVWNTLILTVVEAMLYIKKKGIEAAIKQLLFLLFIFWVTKLLE